MWDVEEKKAKFVQVENDYGFKVVNVENGVIKNKMNLLKNQNEKLVEDLRNSKLNYQSLKIGKSLESDNKHYVKKRIDKMIEDLDFCITNLSS